MGCLVRWLLLSVVAVVTHQANVYNMGSPGMVRAPVAMPYQHGPRSFNAGGRAQMNMGPRSLEMANEGAVQGGWLPRTHHRKCPSSLPYCTTTKHPMTKPTCSPKLPYCTTTKAPVTKPTCPPNKPACTTPKPTCPPNKPACTTPPPHHHPKQWQYHSHYPHYEPHHHHPPQWLSHYHGAPKDDVPQWSQHHHAGGHHAGDHVHYPQYHGHHDAPVRKPHHRRWYPEQLRAFRPPGAKHNKWARVLPWQTRY